MSPINNVHNNKLVVGLDIGSTNIICAIGHNTESNNAVKLRGISSTASSGIKKGVITNRDELINKIDKVITEAEKMADVKVDKVMISITGEHIRSLNTQAAIPLNGSSGIMEDRAIKNQDIVHVLNLAQAVTLPGDRDIIHTIPQEYIVDTIGEINNPLGMIGRRLEGRVHLVTSSTTAMTNLVSCVEELGIIVEGIVFQPLAAALSTLKKDEMELGITLVDIGTNTTNIAVFHNGAIKHSCVIPVGAANITNDIAVMLQISINEAEKIKIKYASAQSSMSSAELEISLDSNENRTPLKVPENNISKYVEARMEEIFQMVIREIMKTEIKDPLTYGIVLTGGGAELRNIIPLAKDSLGINVREGRPLNIEGTNDFAEQPHYATVMGLLLWPYHSADHMRRQKNQNLSFKFILDKIKHTIEDMF